MASAVRKRCPKARPRNETLDRIRRAGRRLAASFGLLSRIGASDTSSSPTPFCLATAPGPLAADRCSIVRRCSRPPPHLLLAAESAQARRRVRWRPALGTTWGSVDGRAIDANHCCFVAAPAVTRPLLVQSAAGAKRECGRTTHGPRPHLRVSDGQSPGALRSAGMADGSGQDRTERHVAQALAGRTAAPRRQRSPLLERTVARSQLPPARRSWLVGRAYEFHKSSGRRRGQIAMRGRYTEYRDS
jgi:hypothetical protein